MSTNTTGLSTTLSWMGEYAENDSTGAMTAAFEKLLATSSALRQERTNLELRDGVQREAWDLTMAWCQHRARADAGKDAHEIGAWSLTRAEGLWVNCGLLDPALIQEAHEVEALEVELSMMFRVTAVKSSLQVWEFSRCLLRRYQERLGVWEHIQLQERLAAARAEVSAARRDLAVCVADAREFLAENTNSDTELLAKHGKLEVMLPFQAKMTALGKNGGGVKDRTTHRMHMKVTETTRTILNAIDQRLGVYKLKKEFEALYQTMLKRAISLVGSEDVERAVSEEVTANGGAHFQATADDCVGAIEASLGEVRALGSAIADTAEFMAPSFVLEHKPRLNARVVTEAYEEVLEVCPRFRAQVEGSETMPHVVLLPGVGNAILDAESGEVVATVYPTEARQTSLIGAIGEGFLHGEAALRTSYQRLCRLDPSSPKAFTDSFHRDFYHWVKTDSETRRNLTKEVHKWFHQNLVVRRAGD